MLHHPHRRGRQRLFLGTEEGTLSARRFLYLLLFLAVPSCAAAEFIQSEVNSVEDELLETKACLVEDRQAG
jgi:hypothetical protein